MHLIITIIAIAAIYYFLKVVASGIVIRESDEEIARKAKEWADKRMMEDGYYKKDNGHWAPKPK